MATYTLSSSSSTVNEGSNVTIVLDTVGIANGTLIPFSIYGTGIDAADFSATTTLAGNFLIRNNQGKIVIDVKRDVKTEYAETFYLRLTSTGNDETLPIIINDTSRTTTNTIVAFSITSTSSSIVEGSYATFIVQAKDLASGTVVPYRVLGIQADDLATGSLTGLLTFTATGTPNTTQANLTLAIADDRLTEGRETIVLLMSPDFPYTLQVSGTITVQDTSITVPPNYYLSANKQKVVEGSNVVITLSTLNLPDNIVVPYKIIKAQGDITLGDFDRLSSLEGYFPATSGNVAYVTLDIRDDYIFEQSEYFYVATGGNETSSGVIEIVDSGNTLITSDEEYSGNVTIEFLDKADLRANIGSTYSGKSFWKDTTGQLSENMFLQGRTPFASEESIAYYQPFSYVIKSSISIDVWKDSVKSVLHPAGLSIFSEINNETFPEQTNSVSAKVANDAEISTFFTLSTDLRRTTLNASNTRVQNAPITVDLVTLTYNL